MATSPTLEYSAEPVFNAVSTTIRICPRAPLESTARETWGFIPTKRSPDFKTVAVVLSFSKERSSASHLVDFEEERIIRMHIFRPFIFYGQFARP
jgi:hypothetical protein